MEYGARYVIGQTLRRCTDGRRRSITIAWALPSTDPRGELVPASRWSKVEDHMPTYEYHCRDCKHVFDRVEPLAEHGGKAPHCPKCKSKNVEQVLTPFFAKTSHKA
jgi:putative FmdB family regulatory protein